MAVLVHYKDVQKELKWSDEELSQVEANIRDLQKLVEDVKTPLWRAQISSGYTVNLSTHALLNAHIQRKEQLELQIKELKEVDVFLTKAMKAFK